MEWYLKVVKENYANFNGRARRKEYWMFTLINILIIIALQIIAGILVGVTNSEAIAGIFSIIIIVYGLAILIPSLAVTVRRLHDTGKSGWWILIALIPFGGIVLLVFECIDSTPGENQYGANPKGI